MASVTLLNNPEDSIYVCRQNADSFGLSQHIFDRVSVQYFGHPEKPFLELGVEYLASINRDKRTDVWIDLRDNESVHIEELCQTLHGKVRAY